MSLSKLIGKDSAPQVAAPAPDKSCLSEAWTVAIISLICSSTLVAWFACSHRLPTIDEAGHILNSLTYRDLFRHPHFFDHNWWFQIFTVNRFYPPFAHAFGGALKAVFGVSRVVDMAALVFFNIVLTACTYGLTRICWQSRKAAVFAAIIINCYPLIALLNHAFWLDFPLVAMISLALYAVLRYGSEATWKNAVFAGVCLGLAAMTKQIAVTYLALPTLYVLANQLAAAKRNSGPQIQAADSCAKATIAPATASGNEPAKAQLQTTLCQALAIALIAAAICAPWVLLNAGQAKNIADECSTHIARTQSYWGNFSFYLAHLPTIMSPLLLAIMPGAFLCLPRTALPRLAPLGLSVLGGLLSISTLAWIFPKPQYEAPILIVAAVISGIVLCRMAESSARIVRGFSYAFLALAALQIIALEFAPYPVSVPAFLAEIPHYLKADIKEPRLGFVGLNPEGKQDWGQVWTIRQIDQVDAGRPVWLNVLSSTPRINVHTFEVVALDSGSKVKPTTSRLYSIGGDTVSFSPEKALYYQWYLVPSKNTYQNFADANSEQQFEQLKSFIANSGHFRIVANKVLPDDSSVTLYRQL